MEHTFLWNVQLRNSLCYLAQITPTDTCLGNLFSTLISKPKYYFSLRENGGGKLGGTGEGGKKGDKKAEGPQSDK